MLVKIKKLVPEAKIPVYANEGDAGMDLVAVSKTLTGNYVEYDTGIAVEIPENYVGLVFPRSSISKQELLLCNSVAVIDSIYRGSIKLRFKRVEMANVYYRPMHHMAVYMDGDYEVGDKVGQLIILPYPKVVWEVVDELSDTARAENGFGSSGR